MTCRDEILEAARQLSTGSSNGEFTLKDILNYPGFPFCPPDQNLYPPTRLSARQMSSSHVILLPAPVSLGPRSTWNRLKPLLSGHSSDTAPHVCSVFSRRTSLQSPRVSLPARVVPRSFAACRRTAAWSDALLPGGGPTNPFVPLVCPQMYLQRYNPRVVRRFSLGPAGQTRTGCFRRSGVSPASSG